MKAEKVAVVGIGHSKLARTSDESVGTHALKACRNAILDAGVDRSLVDGVAGVCGTDIPTVAPGYVIGGLGLTDVVWSVATSAPSASPVIEGINAVASGRCNYAVCYHAKYRWDTTSLSARKDPLRRAPQMSSDMGFIFDLVAPYAGFNGMAAYMRWHMHHFHSRREHFGMIAVNNRSNAQRNPRAIFHGEPLTLDDYLKAPVVSDPFTMLDMDPPIDGAMAVLITTEERARDLPHKPVLVAAASSGATLQTDMIHQPFDFYPAAKLTVEALWRQSGCGIADMDLVNVYDGFTILTLDWLEAAFCERQGDGAALLDQSWDPTTNTLKFLGRIPMSPHGGNLSEGRVQGMGHVLDAVEQLRGTAGARQVANARRALVVNGTNPVNHGMIFANEG